MTTNSSNRWLVAAAGVVIQIGSGAGYLTPARFAHGLIAWVGASHSLTIVVLPYFIVVWGSVLFMSNPPDDYRPAGWQPPVSQQQQRADKDYTFGAALKTWQWY